VFVASPYSYVLTALQSGANTGSASFTYNYDGAPGTPIVTSLTFNFSGNSYSAVSGVNVIYGNPTFSAVTVASNLGTYYYTSPLLTYTSSISGSWTPSSETTLTNITSGKSAYGFTNPVTFSNIISTTVSSKYTSSLTLAVNANNPSATSAQFSATPISALVDGPSYILVYSTLPQSLPSVTNNNTAIIGFHVPSAVAGAANVPPFLSTTTSYATLPYNNSMDITSTQELQVSNGTFTTPSGQILSYKNYSSYYYNSVLQNTVNYSSVSSSGYRYTTFAWRITGISPSRYNTLLFTMNTTSTITITNNLAYAGANPIQIYYRFENAASPTPTDGSNPLSSAWINGNLQSGTTTGSGNYYTPTDYTQTPTSGLLTSATSSGQFSVFIPPLSITSGTVVYLYCRVGLPMSSAFSFSNITATMT